MCIYCQPVNTQPDPSLSVFGGDIYPPTVRIVDGSEEQHFTQLHKLDFFTLLYESNSGQHRCKK